MKPSFEVRTRSVPPRSMGTDQQRADGPEKVTGRARYGVEHAPADALHAHLVLSTIARGRIVEIDTAGALAHAGVVAVVDHTNAPRLADTSNRELAVLQDAWIAHRGQIVAVVLAETSEAAREGAALVRVQHEPDEHDAELREDNATHRPETVNPGTPADTAAGDVDAGISAADITVRATYRTPHESNNPMEPHQTVARWAPDRDDGDDAGSGPLLTLHDSTQGVHAVAAAVAPVLGLDTDQVRVLAPYVGGGFGSKGEAHGHIVAAALAGASLLVVGREAGLPPAPLAVAGAALCFAVRWLAIRHGWRLPVAK